MPRSYIFAPPRGLDQWSPFLGASRLAGDPTEYRRRRRIPRVRVDGRRRHDTDTRPPRTSLRRNPPSFMSGARASPSMLALSCLYIHLLSTVPHPSPPETILLCTCRRRPLNCGYVPRARRYTGIIISSFRSHSIIPPRTLRSSGLCTIPTINHRYLSHLFINNPPILCPHAPSHHVTK